MELAFFIAVWSVYFVGGNIVERLFFEQYQVFVSSKYTTTTNISANFINGIFLVICGFWGAVGTVDYIGPYTPFLSMVANCALAFFIVDLLVLVAYRHKKFDIYLHHFMAIGIISYPLIFETCGGYVAFGMAFSEMGYLLYVDLLAKRWQVDNERFYKLNDTVHLFKFVFSRVVLMGGLTISGFFEPDSLIVMKIACFLFWCLGMWWAIGLSSRYIRLYPSSRISPVLAKIKILRGKNKNEISKPVAQQAEGS